MKNFDIFSPQTHLQGKFFLEASAGTGKTFAIEHIVLRSILENRVNQIDNILAVTFTNAATNELRERIRSTLTQALHQIQNKLLHNETPSFAYLNNLEFQKSYVRIRGELANIDRITINTLHGFCHTILKKYFPDIHSLSRSLTTTPLQDIRIHIQQYLAKDLWTEVLYPEQFLLLTASKHSDSSYTQHLITTLLSSYNQDPAVILPSKEKLEKLWQAYYQSVDNKNLPLSLTDLNDTTIPKTPQIFPFSDFWNKEVIQNTLQQHLKNYLKTEYSLWLSPDTYISVLDELLQSNRHQDVIDRIRKDFQLVLIDEFQDTDKKQWSIFSKLFNHEQFSGSFFLIGDPKQSIYEWRNADINTYLSAKNSFKDHVYSLADNYRSTSQLLQGINTLFSQCNEIHKTDKGSIRYTPLQSKSKELFQYEDQKPIHFCYYSSDEEIAQWISSEALFLNQKQGIPLGQMAVLVTDSNQATTFMPFCSVPTLFSSGPLKLNKTKTDLLVITFLEACIYPERYDCIQKTLVSFLFGLSAQEVMKEENKIKYSGLFFDLNQHLLSFGVLATFYRLIFLQGEALFSTPIGSTLFFEIEQFCVYLEKISNNPQQQLLHLQHLIETVDKENSLFESYQTDDPNTLKVTTIHSSKGLEYDVVFCLGLDKATKNFGNDCKRKMYVACTRAKKLLYIPIRKEKSKYSSMFDRFCESCNHDRQSMISHLLLSYPESFSLSEASQPRFIETTKKQTELEAPVSFDLTAHPKRMVHSFSTLKASLETSSVNEPLIINPSLQTLPLGKQTGIIIHKILQNITPIFNTSREGVFPIITSFTNKTELEPFQEYIYDLIIKIFSTPLAFSSQTFCLQDVPSNNIFTESEFLLSHQNKLWQGTIDLFFEYNGHFYLIDWKTSFLGQEDQDYSIDNMTTYIKNEYLDYQANIYLYASQQFLDQFESAYEVEMAFLFLRGAYTPTSGFLLFGKKSTLDPFAIK